MVATVGKKIKFELDFSGGELDGERDEEGPAGSPRKRRRTKQPKPSKDDPAFNPGSWSGTRKEKATPGANELITRRNGRGGKLRDLMNVPVDIFIEVCCYLHPYDLRRLALTSKRLRDLLMTKKAKHIWKAAIASIPDLPECPTDLSEPQYVFLLYASECYTVPMNKRCTSRGTTTDWFHRVRFCTACYAKKMATDYLSFRKKTRRLGLNTAFLSLIPSWLDSSLGYEHGAVYYIEAIEKAGREYETLSKEQAEEYLSRLKDMRSYQYTTATDMLRWKDRQIASRAHDIAREKNARFESIKLKLLELGWNEKDFPIWDREFRDLVFKDQKLTAKIWQNIQPELEAQLETYRNSRLEGEKQKRRNNREYAISKFYHQLGPEALNLAFEHRDLNSLLPKVEEVFAIPSIRALLENDTETVTEEQWIGVAPDARLFLLKWCRDCLKQLTDRLDHNAMAPANKSTKRTEATNSKAETAEGITTSIEGLRAKLSRATAVWSCDGCYHKNVFWFPHAIKHVSGCHSFNNMDGMLSMLQPLRRDDQKLVVRLLRDLKLDPKTAKSEPPVEDQNEKNLLCTRCDERIAKYMSWNEMVDHFLAAQRWFEKVTEAVRKSPKACYPSRTVNSELPKIINDHDWASRDALLVRQDDEETKEAVLKLQDSFSDQGMNDPLCNVKGIGGKGSKKNLPKEVKWCCLLCPKSYRPYACSTGKIKLHIRSKHGKEPDLETDTTLEDSYPSHPCPL
ncbi:hypothetical protein FS837_000376 [Tulasnella sp. UAMH 9824]|nr:hypothetical protein FS837_000376 [Tulasnella sp. UAMH 9824]